MDGDSIRDFGDLAESVSSAARHYKLLFASITDLLTSARSTAKGIVDEWAKLQDLFASDGSLAQKLATSWADDLEPTVFDFDSLSALLRRWDETGVATSLWRRDFAVEQQAANTVEFLIDAQHKPSTAWAFTRSIVQDRSTGLDHLPWWLSSRLVAGSVEVISLSNVMGNAHPGGRANIEDIRAYLSRRSFVKLLAALASDVAILVECGGSGEEVLELVKDQLRSSMLALATLRARFRTYRPVRSLFTTRDSLLSHRIQSGTPPPRAIGRADRHVNSNCFPYERIENESLCKRDRRTGVHVAVFSRNSRRNRHESPRNYASSGGLKLPSRRDSHRQNQPVVQPSR